jgi:hypothetical protein
MKNKLLVSLTMAATMMTGCASLENVYPVSSVSTPMDREDYCILDNVRGISETRSYFFGLFKVINNKAVTSGGNADNVLMNNQYSTFLGVAEEPDRYSFVKPRGLFEFSSTEDRAYFNALSVLPEEADSVIGKSYYKEVIRHIPAIYKHEMVEFKGKAIRLKSDRDIRDNIACVSR